MDWDQDHPFDLPKDLRKREQLRYARYRELGPRALSASSLKTFQSCKRKWWFKKVERLKERMHRNAALGTVLHSVLERFLLADDIGRDEQNAAALLFPPGWERTPKNGDLTPTQQSIVRGLVRRAIKDGVVARRPGRLIEAEFWWPADPAATVLMHGYLDHVVVPERTLEDHKSSGSTRYLLGAKPTSKNFLGADTQMLVYAEMLRVMLDGWDSAVPSDPREQDPDKMLHLAHNQFVTNPEKPLVRKTSCSISPLAAAAHWNGTVRRAAEEIDELVRTKNEYSEIPEAPDSSACHAYGGCPFLKICFGDQTPDRYRESFEKREARARSEGLPTTAPAPPAEEKETTDMSSMLDKLRAKSKEPAPEKKEPSAAKAAPAQEKPAKAEKPEKPEKPAKKASKPKATTKPGEPFDKPAAPWSSLDCSGCRQSDVPIAGMKKDLDGGCAVCRVRNAKADKPVDRDFKIEKTESGISWEVREACAARVIEALGEASVVGEIDVELGDTQQKDDVGEEPAPAPGEKELFLVFGKPEGFCKGLTEALQVSQFAGAFIVREDGAICTYVPEDVTNLQDFAKKYKAALAAEQAKPSPVKEIIDEVVTEDDLTEDARGTLSSVTIDVKDLNHPRAIDESAKGRGRRRSTFTLYIGCAPFEGVSKVILAERLLDRIGAELAKEAGVETLYELPVAERRDCIAAAVLGMLEDLKGSHIVMPKGYEEDGDLSRLGTVLRGQATGLVLLTF